MKPVLAIIVCLALLSGCAPLALFANGWGNEYSPYKSNLGVYVASDSVNTLCLSPALRLVIWNFEGFFGKKVVMNSGYRTPWHNYAVGGADGSLHKKCMAADFFIPGVSKNKLIAYAMRDGIVGGLGCYPGKKFIHVDVRQRPRGHKGPVTFNGC
ncbi:YcbK family protein [Mariluticola halotolerans]|uniref:YcbK family protein n=1 Tax=Mariluticola halotolerans TaxID=2909283 RepID=UPI0026E121A2|nr:D-Ala-D-Ala carboxypeptidase family metallohydrolase [Mariluticola halotolerans]UJQ95594.1 D-Ala-D-Ala carboxypeptidase family metallohydrolase [Mariluticola halotolerans]